MALRLCRLYRMFYKYFVAFDTTDTGGFLLKVLFMGKQL